MADRGPAKVAFASAWLSAEEEAGRLHGPFLLAMPSGRWRSEMNRDLNLRRYGTLRFLLDAVRADFFQHPIRSRERAAVVVEYAEDVEVPEPHFRAALAGRAWKEYANALRYAGELQAALDAAKRSRVIYNTVGSLACDAAKAHLSEALVHRELGDLDRTLAIAAQCARVFLDFQDAEAYMHARMTQALVFADCGRHREAMEILSEAGKDAEKRGDRRTLAICLHNSADCARALGDLAAARELDARALAHYEELGMTAEKPRLRALEAMALVGEGRVSAGIMQLYIARSEYLSLGMNGSAAACGLDIVRLKYDRGEELTAECAELIETLTRAGMIQSAIEALAYLREQARNGTIDAEKIRAVGEYVREAASGSQRMFLPPEGGT